MPLEALELDASARRRRASRTSHRSCCRGGRVVLLVLLARRQQRSMHEAKHGRWTVGRELLVAPGVGGGFVV
jgi:hypothetical protein